MKFKAVLIIALCVGGPVAAQRTPQLTLSQSRVQQGLKLDVHGVGFTPKRYALSHLRRPDGTESGVRRFLTDDRGEFYHTIDTALLEDGVHELWAVDEVTKSTSNLVGFEVHSEPDKQSSIFVRGQSSFDHKIVTPN